MAEFAFPATITVEAESEAEAATLAEHAAEDCDQHLPETFHIEKDPMGDFTL